MTLDAIVQWVKDHPVEVLAIAVWLVANVAPRPHPEDLTGWRRVFWTVVDRLCVLTATALPGRFKMVMMASPKASATAPESAGKEEKA